MTTAEIKSLTTQQITDMIAAIGDHPFAERFVRELAARQLAA